METGFVVTPFLPGDSLLFAAGALAGVGFLEISPLLVLLILAAVSGDTVNYLVGRMTGPRVFTEESKYLRRDHLLRTQEFYDRHGGKTIVMARYIPIIRTFAPFVASIGKMHYGRFLMYNVTGGITWVVAFGLLGYFFGSAPMVKRNFTMVILAIIVLFVLPVVFELFKARIAYSSSIE